MAKVQLHGLNVTDNAIAHIGFFGKAVTDLTLSGLQSVGEKGFWVMANTLGLQKLKSLAITSSSSLHLCIYAFLFVPFSNLSLYNLLIQC